MYGHFIHGISEKHDKYGFVDEREIRISTGIMLLFTMTSFFLVLFKAEYSIPLVLVSIVILEFIMKIFIGPKWSIFGSLVRMNLEKSKEIWVGAVQKRFAWSIGLFLSVFALYCILILGGYVAPTAGPQAETVGKIWMTTAENLRNHELIVTPLNPTLFACILCITFMWLESVAGYCVGCRIYGWLVRRKWMKEHKNQNCVGGVCEVKE
ncbi:MAG: hypothetical protein HHAS10_02620 [Candidatus Altimarinota bacterium]